jgi:hypothetical protein
MSTAAEKIARLDRSIARAGDSVTIQRTATAATGVVTVTEQVVCPAHVRASAPQGLLDEGGVKEIAVIISATPLLTAGGSPPAAFGVPSRDDRILIQGEPSNIVEVAPIRYGGALVRVNLLCRG